jgi:uncharacterized repeat protein (TIGR01451 family)
MSASGHRILSHGWDHALVSYLVIVTALVRSSALSQIVHDASSTTLGEGTTLTWAHSMGSGTNGILIVGVSNRRSNRTVVSVAYAGMNFQRAGFQNSGANTTRMEMWYLLSPPAGTNNVVVTLSGSAAAVAGAVSFFGVDQTAPIGAFSSAAGTGPNVSLLMASASNETVVDVIAAPGPGLSLTQGPNQTAQWIGTTGTAGNEVFGGSSRTAGAAMVSLSWILGASVDWGIGAVSLKPANSPNLVLTLAQSSSNPPPGTDVVYTMDYSNIGNGPAENAVVVLSAPPNTSFVADGVTLNGVRKTDAADGDEVTLSGSTITVNLGTVLAGAGGTLSYKVLIQ